MRRVKDWIIRSLGGLTWQDHLEDMEWFMSANVRNRNQAVMSARRADEWEKRGRYAEARVKTLESLDDRLRRLVALRVEARESREWMYRAQVPREELTEYIRGKLAIQMADQILERVGMTEMEDRVRMEYVWKCEAYLLKKED